MSLFASIAVVLGAAAAGGVLAKVARLPVMLGYLVAGISLAAIGFFAFPSTQTLVSGMGQLGVTLLLFLVGLELPLPTLQKLGRVALLSGLAQILVTAVFAYGLSYGLGYSLTAALFLAVALTFSSTIVVVKLLSEKGELDSLHAKIAIGSLLVQDFVAIGVLVVLAGWTGGEGVSLSRLALTVAKGAGLTAVAVWASGRVFAPIFSWLAKSTEILFVTSVGWCLVVAALVAWPGIGLGVEMGGFLAGLALANSVAGSQIVARIRPLRDFFLTWFFVWLGASVGLGAWREVLVDALLLSGFVLLVKPLLMSFLVTRFGFGRRVAFLSGVALAQISEFSLVIVAVGVKLGAIPTEILTLVTLVGVVTMTLSSFLMSRSKSLYHRCQAVIRRLFKASGKSLEESTSWADHAILFGHRRTGRVILPALLRLGLPVVVVDFDPQVVEDLTGSGIEAVYGDVADVDMTERLNLARAKMVVSTVTDVEDNLALLGFIHRLPTRTRPVVVVTAADEADASRLYRLGADFVLVPHEVGGEYLAQVIERCGVNRQRLRSLQYQRSHLRGQKRRIKPH